eukprot:UN10485
MATLCFLLCVIHPIQMMSTRHGNVVLNINIDDLLQNIPSEFTSKLDDRTKTSHELSPAAVVSAGGQSDCPQVEIDQMNRSNTSLNVFAPGFDYTTYIDDFNFLTDMIIHSISTLFWVYACTVEDVSELVYNFTVSIYQGLAAYGSAPPTPLLTHSYDPSEVVITLLDGSFEDGGGLWIHEFIFDPPIELSAGDYWVGFDAFEKNTNNESGWFFQALNDQVSGAELLLDVGTPFLFPVSAFGIDPNDVAFFHYA